MEKNSEIFHDVAWNIFLRFIPARVHLLTHSLANVVAHFTPILMCNNNNFRIKILGCSNKKKFFRGKIIISELKI